MWHAAWRKLNSPRLALALLLLLATYAAAAGLALPEVAAPPPRSLTAALRLHRPFASVPFLAVVALLFLNTLACTVSRTRATWLVWSDQGRGVPLEARDDLDIDVFMRTHGLRPRAMGWARYRFAVWGGWVFHVGLLVLIAGVSVQQALHDGGAFELAEGESKTLSDPGAVFDRESGFLAAAEPPRLSVTLDELDPFRKTPSYLADRWSHLTVRSATGAETPLALDRVEGVDCEGTTLYQAVPTGLALVLELDRDALSAVHLQHTHGTDFEADVDDLAGNPVRFRVHSERSAYDPEGPGRITVFVEAAGERRGISPGDMIPFGPRPVRVVALTRWGGYTYAKSPGIPLVFAGFAVVLLGSFMMCFPAATARRGRPEEGVAAWVWTRSGATRLQQDWAATAAAGAGAHEEVGKGG